jgi:exopolysaccharide production protein ExoF
LRKPALSPSVLACFLAVAVSAGPVSAQQSGGEPAPALVAPAAEPPPSLPAAGNDGAAGVPSGNATGEALRDYVAAATHLTLRFRDYQELTGDYRVAADLTISIPVLGRISIDGLTTAELEQVLARRVRQIAGADSYVTVEIAGYRPVFVTGTVSRSGASAWLPGMTVLQAVALSGGVAYPQASPAAAAAADPARLARALSDKKQLLAEKARVDTERAGDETIETPEALVTLAGKPEADRLVAAQQALLDSRLDQLDAEIAVLQRGRDLAAAELTGLERQAEDVARQLELRRENSTRVAALQKKGFAAAERGLEQELKVLELEEKATNISVATARIQATVADFERQAVTRKQARTADLEQEAIRLERAIAAADIDLQAAQFLMGAAALPAAGGQLKAPEPRYRITRTDKEGTKTLDADEGTAIQPGDVLVVSLVRP